MAFPVPTEFNPTILPLPHPDAYPGEPREFAMALMQRKDEIEKEIVSFRKRNLHRWHTGADISGRIERGPCLCEFDGALGDPDPKQS
jgi:hypothetical protein